MQLLGQTPEISLGLYIQIGRQKFELRGPRGPLVVNINIIVNYCCTRKC